MFKYLEEFVTTGEDREIGVLSVCIQSNNQEDIKKSFQELKQIANKYNASYRVTFRDSDILRAELRGSSGYLTRAMEDLEDMGWIWG